VLEFAPCLSLLIVMCWVCRGWWLWTGVRWVWWPRDKVTSNWWAETQGGRRCRGGTSNQHKIRIWWVQITHGRGCLSAFGSYSLSVQC